MQEKVPISVKYEVLVDVGWEYLFGEGPSNLVYGEQNLVLVDFGFLSTRR